MALRPTFSMLALFSYLLPLSLTMVADSLRVRSLELEGPLLLAPVVARSLILLRVRHPLVGRVPPCSFPLFKKVLSAGPRKSLTRRMLKAVFWRGITTATRARRQLRQEKKRILVVIATQVVFRIAHCTPGTSGHLRRFGVDRDHVLAYFLLLFPVYNKQTSHKSVVSLFFSMAVLLC